MKIHVWVPDYVSATGGIQAFSRFVVRALRDVFTGAHLVVFSKNDRSYSDPADEPASRFKPFGYWPQSLRTPAYAAALVRHAARERPDLIITTHVNFAPVADFVRRVFRIPFVAVGHGIEVWQISNPRLRNALRNARRLVAVSEFTREKMAEALSMPAEKIFVLPDTVDAEKFRPAEKPRFLLKRYDLNAHQPVILTIARLSATEQYKGYDQVLRALPTVSQQFPDVRYILAGRGSDRARVEALIRELGVSEHVILAGYVPDHELSEHYNLCDVFAMPSKGEGFGIVFLEALACGKPVVAGNRDGSVDAVLNGEIGVLVDPDNVEEISNALIHVLRGQLPARRALQLGERSEVGFRLVELYSSERDQTAEGGGQCFPKILHEPEALRREVIAAYGYDRFVERLREILDSTSLSSNSQLPTPSSQLRSRRS